MTTIENVKPVETLTKSDSVPVVSLKDVKPAGFTRKRVIISKQKKNGEFSPAPPKDELDKWTFVPTFLEARKNPDGSQTMDSAFDYQWPTHFDYKYELEDDDAWKPLNVEAFLKAHQKEFEQHRAELKKLNVTCSKRKSPTGEDDTVVTIEDTSVEKRAKTDDGKDVQIENKCELDMDPNPDLSNFLK